MPKSLERLIDKEKTLGRIPIQDPASIRVSGKKDSSLRLEIETASGPASAPLDRQLKHQLGNHLWPEANNAWEAISDNWDELETRNWDDLEQLLRSAMETRNLELLFLPDNGKAHNYLYGIVTDVFQRQDQAEFRQLLLNELNRQDVVELRPDMAIEFNWGKPSEVYWLRQTADTPFGVGLQINYGFNNGYSAHEITYTRKIREEDILLTGTNNRSQKWIHSKKSEEIGKFVSQAVSGAREFLNTSTVNHEECFREAISPDQVSAFLERLPLARISLERVWKEFRVKQKQTGNSAWSLVQAFAGVATHQGRSLSRDTQKRFRQIGSDILDKSFAVVRDEDLVKYAIEARHWEVEMAG